MTLPPLDNIDNTKRPGILLALKGPEKDPLAKPMKILADKKANNDSREEAARQISEQLGRSRPQNPEKLANSLLAYLGDQNEAVRAYCADSLGSLAAALPLKSQSSLLDKLVKLRLKNDKFKNGVDMALGAMHGSRIDVSIKAKIEAFWKSLD